MILPRHGTKPTHLPHQPLIDRELVAIGRPIELSRFAREVLQDGTAFKEGEWRAVRAVMINDRWHTVIGRYAQKIRFELITFADVHQMRGIGKVHFLKRNRDFLSVWCGPVVKIDHRTCHIVALGQYSGYCVECKGELGQFEC